jgi:hypothetical protein
MFEFLSLLGEPIKCRYETVERNIKSASNSFYDSYLDLLEATVKTIAENEDIPFDDSKTCGAIVRSEAMQKYLRESLGLDEHTIVKIGDYTLKVNHHKHHNEKTVSTDAVVNYLSVYFSFTSSYAKKKFSDSVGEFDPSYFVSIFGESERENARLLKEVSSLSSELKEAKLSSDDIERYKQLLSAKASQYQSLEDQNAFLQRQVSALKDIKLSSMESKLNKTIDMLNDLQDYLAESRAVSLGLGYMIVGKDKVGKYVDEAKEEMKKDGKVDKR